MGIGTYLKYYVKDTGGVSKLIADRLKERGWVALGEKKDITPDDVEKIIELSLHGAEELVLK